MSDGDFLKYLHPFSLPFILPWLISHPILARHSKLRTLLFLANCRNPKSSRSFLPTRRQKTRRIPDVENYLSSTSFLLKPACDGLCEIDFENLNVLSSLTWLIGCGVSLSRAKRREDKWRNLGGLLRSKNNGNLEGFRALKVMRISYEVSPQVKRWSFEKEYYLLTRNR